MGWLVQVEQGSLGLGLMILGVLVRLVYHTFLIGA